VAPKILIIGIDNRSNLKYRKMLSIIFLGNIAQPFLRGRLHGAFSMCVSMSDKPFDAEAWDIGGQASALNGLTDATNGLSDMKNAPCNRPLR
jgi:hypothetical protein